MGWNAKYTFPSKITPSTTVSHTSVIGDLLPTPKEMWWVAAIVEALVESKFPKEIPALLPSRVETQPFFGCFFFSPPDHGNLNISGGRNAVDNGR